MMDLIDRLHEDCPLFLTREQFEQSLDGWELDPVEVDGRTIGVFLVKGPEIHFAKFDQSTANRSHLKRLAQVIAQHGYATTRTPKDDARMLRLNARLGFYKVGEDEWDVHLRIDRLRFKEN
jgi:hypothetical protein